MKISDIPRLESNTVEFKELISFDDSRRRWLDTICAFSNCEGGTIFVGVNDSDHKPVGIPKNSVQDLTQHVAQCITSNIENHVTFSYELIDLPNEDRVILCINILPNKESINYLTTNNIDCVYIRIDSSTKKARLSDLIRLIRCKDLVEEDISITNVSDNSVSFNKYLSLYRDKNKADIIEDRNILISSNLIRDGFCTKAGLLFADDSSYCSPLIEISVLDSDNIGTRSILTSTKVSGDIVTCYQKAFSFIKGISFYKFTIEKTSSGSEQSTSFNELVLREAIINSIAHRVYDFENLKTPIHIYCFRNRIEFVTPGYCRSVGYSSQTYKKSLDSIPSIRRNPAIVDSLCKIGLMEAKGSGLSFIYNDYRDLPESFYPYLECSPVSVKLCIFNKKSELKRITKEAEFSGLDNDIVKSPYFRPIDELLERNKTFGIILKSIDENKDVTYDKLATLANLTRDGVKYSLSQMKKAYLVRRVGNNISGTYEIVNEIDRPADFLKLDNDDIQRAVKWCKENFVSQKECNDSYDSYYLKHRLQDSIGLYLTNGQFKGAMIYAGFKPGKTDFKNWSFNISNSSPAIIETKKKYTNEEMINAGKRIVDDLFYYEYDELGNYRCIVQLSDSLDETKAKLFCDKSLQIQSKLLFVDEIDLGQIFIDIGVNVASSKPVNVDKFKDFIEFWSDLKSLYSELIDSFIFYLTNVFNKMVFIDELPF